jgi:uncharacterized protein DUF1707
MSGTDEAGRRITDAAKRASDAEREYIARVISDAAAEGRLTVDEADQRLASVYEAKFRYELAEQIVDLPQESFPSSPVERGGSGRRFPVRLRVHATVATVLSVMLIIRWAASGVPYFWPIGPMFLLWGSFLLHARFVWWSGAAGGPRWIRQRGGPPWLQPQRERSGRDDDG